MEGDGILAAYLYMDKEFQSTPSAWRETQMQQMLQDVTDISIHSLRMEGDRQAQQSDRPHDISIHSLRMEGDLILSTLSTIHNYFNPLPPHGGRHIISYRDNIANPFQSTPSAWRETVM